MSNAIYITRLMMNYKLFKIQSCIFKTTLEAPFHHNFKRQPHTLSLSLTHPCKFPLFRSVSSEHCE